MVLMSRPMADSLIDGNIQQVYLPLKNVLIDVADGLCVLSPLPPPLPPLPLLGWLLGSPSVCTRASGGRCIAALAAAALGRGLPPGLRPRPCGASWRTAFRHVA